MKLHHITLSVLVVCIVILGTSLYISDVADKHSRVVDLEGLDKTSGRLNTTISTIEEVERDITNTTITGVPLLDVPYGMIKGSWGALKTLKNSWGVLFAIFDDTESMMTDQSVGFAIPNWVFLVVKAIILLTVIAIIAYGFFKWKFEDK